MSYIPADGTDVPAFELQTDRVMQFVEAEGAVHHKLILVQSAKFFFVGVEFVLNVADQFLENVLQSDHSNGAAVLVHHHGEVSVTTQKQAEQLLQRHHLRHRDQIAL